MIVEWILDIIETGLVWLAGLFPTYTGANPISSWGGFLGALGDMNYFLPIAEVFAITLAVFVLFPALMGVSLLAWLVAFIRGGSSRG